MQIFRTIGEYFSTHKRQILSLLFFAVFFFIAFDSVWAAGDAASTTTQATQSDQSSNGIAWINTIFKGIAVLLAIMTNLIGLFLYPEWTSGSAIGLDKAVHELWILVSNVVYFVFAFIFVWIAFMNIIGKDSDTFQLQKAIPRFIIGILIVPFSWFFVQFLISVSSVLTAAVLSLPLESLKTYMEENEEGYKFPYCESGYTVDTTQGPTSSPNDVVKCTSGDPVETSLEDVMLGKNGDGAGIYSIMYVYTYGVMRFDDAQKLFKNDVSSVTALIDLIFKSGFSIIFILVYALLVIALGLALFVRGIYLWIFSMFSPVFGLLFFFKKSGGDGMLKLFTLKEFIALAMVPVYVSAALVFGLLFLAVAGKSLSQDDTTSKANRAKITQEDGNKSCLSFIDYKVCWAGVYNSENSDQTIFGGFKGAIGGLIAEIFGIVFLWMAVMAALNQSTITKEVISPIASFGDSIGKLIKDSPKYLPLIPTPGGPMSAAGLGQAGNTFAQSIVPSFTKTGTDFGTRMAGAFGGDKKVADMNAINAQNHNNNQLGDLNNHVAQMQKHISNLDDTLKRDPERAAFLEMIKTHFGDKVYDDVKNSNRNSVDFFRDFKASVDKNKNDSSMPQSGAQFQPKLAGMRNANELKAFFQSAILPQPAGQAGTPPVVRPTNIQIQNNQLHIMDRQAQVGVQAQTTPIDIVSAGNQKNVDVQKLIKALQDRGYENNITEAEMKQTLTDGSISDIDNVLTQMKNNNAFKFKT